MASQVCASFLTIFFFTVKLVVNCIARSNFPPVFRKTKRCEPAVRTQDPILERPNQERSNTILSICPMPKTNQYLADGLDTSALE